MPSILFWPIENNMEVLAVVGNEHFSRLSRLKQKSTFNGLFPMTFVNTPLSGVQTQVAAHR